MISEYTKSTGHFLFGSPRKVLVWVVSALIWVLVIWPNVVYPAQMLNRNPQFDALNKETFATIPVYPEARLVSESSGGNTGSVIGRVLRVEYQLVATDDEVFGFFDEYLGKEGWSRIPYDRNIAYYQRDNSCLNVLTNREGYLVLLWHDYGRQPYAPWSPPQWLLEGWTFTKTSFAECR